MKRNPIKWIASGCQVLVSRRKVTRSDESFPRGRTFHDTWEEALVALVDRLVDERLKAERDLQDAQRRLASTIRAEEKARKLQKPMEETS